jgi:hypothetical protein
MDCTAESSAVAVLQLLLEQGVLVNVARLTSALNYAGSQNKPKEEGAQWPAVLCCSGVRWSGESLAWARAEGCTAPTQVQPQQQQQQQQQEQQQEEL